MRLICDECKNEFSMNAVDIKECHINISKNDLILVYFECPKCNKIYRVMLKDKHYEELKKDLEKTKKRIRKNYGNLNEELARMLNNMVNKKHERLKNHVTILNEKFNGTFTFATYENNCKDNNVIIYHENHGNIGGNKNE